MVLPSSPLSSFDSRWQSTLGWQPHAAQIDLFQRLYTDVLASNQRFNLTRLTNPQDFWEKHLWDSLWGISPWLSSNALDDQRDTGTEESPGPQTLAIGDHSSQSLQVIDIGTGAGFPGIPIAIIQPTWCLTLLDATRKKIAFLEQLQQTLALENIAPLCDRAEQLGQNPIYRQKFDLALIRAVSEAAVCAEYALPFLKIGGVAILYRGQWTTAETGALERVLDQLGGTIAALTQVDTPLTRASRHCIYIQKQNPTPEQFPRRVGLPQRSPLE